jgi:hypothetical protein
MCLCGSTRTIRSDFMTPSRKRMRALLVGAMQLVDETKYIYRQTVFNPYRKMLGTPQILEINVHIERLADSGAVALDLRALAKQVLSLTKLHWTSTDSLCGEPITTKYAGDIAHLTAAFLRQEAGMFRLHSVLERTPWFI